MQLTYGFVSEESAVLDLCFSYELAVLILNEEIQSIALCGDKI